MPILLPQYVPSAVSATISSANLVMLFRIVIPMQWEFSKFAVQITNTAAGGFMGVGLYLINYQISPALIARSIPIPTDNSGAVVVSTYLGDTIIPAGEYYMAWTASDVTAEFAAIGEEPLLLSLLSYDTEHPSYGQAESLSSGGVLPDQLGSVITDSGPIAAIALI